MSAGHTLYAAAPPHLTFHISRPLVRLCGCTSCTMYSTM